MSAPDLEETLEAQIPALRKEHNALRRQYGYFENRQAWLLMLAIENQIQYMETIAQNLLLMDQGAAKIEQGRTALAQIKAQP